MEHNKKILMISYHYPPSTAIGGMRIYGFAKGLTELGWKVYVLTVKERYIKNIEYERIKAEKRIGIYKSNNLPKISTIILKTIKSIGNKKQKQKKIDSLDRQITLDKQSKKNINAIQKLKIFIDSFLLLPDEHRNWIIPALFKACKIIRTQDIKIVFTSCPPYTVHLIGLILKYIFKKKWVADYRDPWTKPFNKHLYPTSKLSLHIEEILENAVIEKADFITSTTENLNQKYIDMYKQKNKFFCLTNGYDSEIIHEKANENKYDKFTITYAGTLYFGRSPEPIFKAIKLLKKEQIIRNGDLILKLIGNCHKIDGKKTSDIIEKYDLVEEVDLRRSVIYEEAIKIIKKSHIGLVFAPNQPFQIPAKIYDMIGTNTKVLAISDDGATKNMVESLNIGECFHWEDIEGIKNYIRKEYMGDRKINMNLRKIKNTYDQKVISKTLSIKLNEILERDEKR